MAYTLANLETDIKNYTEVDDTVFSSTILTAYYIAQPAGNRAPNHTSLEVLLQAISNVRTTGGAP